MKPETQMKPRQYTLSTGKSRITLQAGQTNIHKAAPGESYRVLKRQGENDQEKLADDVVASRHGQDLQLDYADGTTLTLQGWYTESDTSVTLPADGTSTQVMTPGSTEGAALADGSHVLYAHGSPDALASMTSGHPGLEHILSGLSEGPAGAGHPLTYLPQSHSYAGYLAGALGLGGVVGVAAASGGHGGHNKGGDNSNNGGGEAPVQNAVQLHFVGGPALSSNDLKVEIYQADGKTLIGTGNLGADGSVTVSAGSYSGVVIVKLVNSGSAADYLDEATGAGKDLSAQLWSMGVISGNNSTLVLNVNVLTTLAYTKAQEAIGGTPGSPATLSATQVTDTATAISNLFGVDNILNTTVTATNGGSFDAADGLTAGEKYGLLLAAFSGAEANAGATTQTILDTVAAGITLGSSNTLSDGAQSLLIQGAAATSDASGGVSLIIDTHAPVFSSATTASVNENIGAGTVVWTAVATDPSQFSYSLGTNGDSALFSINASTGAVTLTSNPDYESKASYSFTVVATDAAGNASSQTVTLAVNNLDEQAPSFTTGNSSDSFATATVSVIENTAASTAIYTAQAVDNDAADGGEHVTYSLIDGNNGTDAQYFSIDAATGAITFKASPDYEGTHAPEYTFIVAATDAAGHVTTQTVTVSVTDVDEIAPTVTLDGSSTGPVMLSPATSYIYPNGFDTTALGDGSFLVTWAGNNNGSYGIYAQRLSAQGVALGDPVQLASGATNTYSNELDSVISVTAINDAGAYAVAWTGKNGASTDSSIYTQLFNADGSPISAAVQLDGAASAQDIAPQIATLTDGGYLVTWYINNGGVYVQRFDDAGVAVGNTVPLAAPGSSNNASPQLTVLDSGGYVLTWQGQTSGDYHIYVQQFDATGTASTTNPVVLDATTGNTSNYETLPQITALANGGYVVTWSGNNYSNSNYNSSTYVQQFDATGARVGSIVELDNASNGNFGNNYTYPFVAALADGGYAITWMEYAYTNGSDDYTVFVQQFSAGGSKVGAAVQLDASHNNTSNNYDELPRITTLGDGGYVVTWMSLGSSNWDVYVQKFDASGGLVGGVVQLQASSGATDLYPQVTAVGTDGEYMVTWYGYASGISGYHLFVQKFNADGSTHENLVVLNHDGHATVQSTESGTIYLVNDNVQVSQLSDITGAASNQWASTTVTANTRATISAANLAEGTYHAYAVDAAGNLSVISGSSVLVDNTVPVFTSAATAADITDSTAVGDTIYTAAATDAHGVTYSLSDTQHFRINTSTGVVTLLSSPASATGAQFTVTATDAAGNQTTHTVTYNVVDTTPPGVTLTRDVDGVENSSQTVTVQSTEAGTVYLVSDSVTVTNLSSLTAVADNLVNSVAVAANAGTTLALTGLAEGTYHAYAVDASGNVSAISGSSVTVDNTAPVFTSAATAADITDSTAVGDTIYTAAATDAHGVTYSLSDTQHFRINTSTGVVTLLSSPASATGAQFTVTATDAAGNQTTHTVTYNVVDTMPPGVTLTRDVDGVENSSQTVTVQSTEAGTVYLVSDSVTVTNLSSLTAAADNLVNSVAVAANAGTTLALTGLAEGTYHAYAVDAAGNVSIISGSSVIVDNTAPVIAGGATATGATIVGGTAAGTQVYDANATDAHAITYSLDAGSLANFSINPTTGVVTLNNAAIEGSYNFIVTATDAAGNHSSQTVTLNVSAGLNGSAMVSGSTTDTSTEMNINVGLEKLSNGNTVMEYMKQTGGDNISWDPTGPLYAGVIKVLDASNNVIKTVDISIPNGYTMMDTQVKALANGGFVVAWSQTDTLNYSDYSVHYAIYDNSGNLQSSNTLAAPGTGVTIAAQSSANGGDFAIAYQTMGTGTDQQEAISVFHYNGSGLNFTQGAQTLIGGNSTSANFGGVASPAVQLMKFQLTPGVLTALSDGSYVLASEVYDWIGTPGQSATSTPIGAFIFKLDATGSLANFDSGTTWQRVNWNDEQGSPTNAIAFDGGFAVFSQEYRTATWEVTLYNNNGTLITTHVQSNAVYGMGTQSYHAVDVGAMDKATHDELQYSTTGYLAASATAYDNGTDLVFVFPDGHGGLSQVSISKTTGELTSAVTDTGITVPQGGQLYNVRIVSDGAGGHDITYSVLFDTDTSDGGKAGYAVGDIYQIGLNAGPAPASPIVTDAHIAITSTPGGVDGSTYKIGDTVTAVWDNSSSGDANTSTVTGVTMDFSQFGASTPATAYDDGTHGDVAAGDGKYTAQYTITAGSINDVHGLNVSVTATTASHTSTTAADSTGLTVDSSAPVLSSSTPQDNGGSVATGSNLTLTFNENVLAGSGHITLVNDGNSSLNKVIDITDSSQVTISGHTVTVNPTTDLAAGANYHVQIDSTALHDAAGNNYAGISTPTGLNFTTASASNGDPSIVVFDLTTGQSSDHNGRVFDANTAYTIYIKVNSNSSSLVGLDSNEMWSGAQNLGTDDKIVLVGSGSAVKGGLGGQVTMVNHPANSIGWIAGFSTSHSKAAGIAANGQFTRNGMQNMDLWNGTWAANPDADNAFAQVYLQAMPAGVLTSQGLVLP